MEIPLACISGSSVHLNAKQSVTLNGQIRRISRLLKRAFLPVGCHRGYTDPKADIKTERCAAARLIIILGLLLDTGQHILKGAFLALIAIGIHIGDIVGYNIQTLLETGHRDGCAYR
ncbi:hypothetical protein D3C73_579130 [compost metagenome]